MNVMIQSKQLEVTQGLRSHIMQQARKLARLGKKIINVRVFLEKVPHKKNDIAASQVTYQVEVPGNDVVIKSRAVDMYHAVVKATHAVVRRVRKVAEKRRTIKRGDHSDASDRLDFAV